MPREPTKARRHPSHAPSNRISRVHNCGRSVRSKRWLRERRQQPTPLLTGLRNQPCHGPIDELDKYVAAHVIRRVALRRGRERASRPSWAGEALRLPPAPRPRTFSYVPELRPWPRTCSYVQRAPPLAPCCKLPMPPTHLHELVRPESSSPGTLLLAGHAPHAPA